MGIKKIDKNAEHKYVSLHDDAIDDEKSELDKYMLDYDTKYLVFLPDWIP